MHERFIQYNMLNLMLTLDRLKTLMIFIINVYW